MGFSDLPAELVLHICSYLDRRTLKVARAVCIKFRDAATPELFRSAIACARYVALSSLQKISTHQLLPTYVKEIVFDGSSYDPILAGQESLYTEQADQHPNVGHGFVWEKHKRYKRYQELFHEQETVRNDGILIAEMTRALEWLPNVSAIVYSPGPHHIPLESKLMRDLLPRGQSSTHPRGTWMDSQIQSTQHGIHHIIGAIYEAQYTGIREFRVAARSESSNDAQSHSLSQVHLPQTAPQPQAVPPPPHGFNPPQPAPGTQWFPQTQVGHPPLRPPTQTMFTQGTEFTLSVFDFNDVESLEAGKYFFSFLTRLEMNLSLLNPDGGREPAGARGLSQLMNLAGLLAETKNLEYLLFHLSHWQPTAHRMYGHIVPHNQPIFPFLPFRITWPKLRSLSLGGIYVDEEELMEVIDRHKGTLKELRFRHCSLFSGTWADIADDILSTTDIVAFSLDHVNETTVDDRYFGDLADEERDHWQYEVEIALDSDRSRYLKEPSHKTIYQSRRNPWD